MLEDCSYNTAIKEVVKDSTDKANPDLQQIYSLASLVGDQLVLTHVSYVLTIFLFKMFFTTTNNSIDILRNYLENM